MSEDPNPDGVWVAEPSRISIQPSTFKLEPFECPSCGHRLLVDQVVPFADVGTGVRQVSAGVVLDLTVQDEAGFHEPGWSRVMGRHALVRELGDRRRAETEALERVDQRLRSWNPVMRWLARRVFG